MWADPFSRSRKRMYHDVHGPSCLMSMKKPVLHESFMRWHHEWYVMLFLPQTWSAFLPYRDKLISFDGEGWKACRLMERSYQWSLRNFLFIHHCRELFTRNAAERPSKNLFWDHINYRISLLSLVRLLVFRALLCFVDVPILFRFIFY